LAAYSVSLLWFLCCFGFLASSVTWARSRCLKQGDVPF
jgi:hypothetical protein